MDMVIVTIGRVNPEVIFFDPDRTKSGCRDGVWYLLEYEKPLCVCNEGEENRLVVIAENDPLLKLLLDVIYPR
jgi:hypothetical protein